MTGFGRGEVRNPSLFLDVEIKTINHRYKDFNIRLPRKYMSFEEKIRNVVTEKVSRGRIDVFLNVTHLGAADITLNYNAELAEEYVKVLETISEQFPALKKDMSVNSVARYPDVVSSVEAEEDLEETWKIFEPAVREAVDTLVESRVREGETLKKDFIKRIGIIAEEVGKIGVLTKGTSEKYAEELNENIEKYNIGVIDRDRIATEIALFAEKINITEELVRLDSHLKNFLKIIEKNEPVGRKLDFLLQEINREANTIASKSNSFEISSSVVEIKSELEKIREQIQNIE